jgi:hypothetical protein
MLDTGGRVAGDGLLMPDVVVWAGELMEIADNPWLAPSSESTLSNNGRSILSVVVDSESDVEVERENRFIEIVRVKGVTEG